MTRKGTAKKIRSWSRKTSEAQVETTELLRVQLPDEKSNEKFSRFTNFLLILGSSIANLLLEWLIWGFVLFALAYICPLAALCTAQNSVADFLRLKCIAERRMGLLARF